MKNTYLFTFLSAFILFAFVGCEDKDNSSPIKMEPIQKSKLTGLIEKGPFLNGSNVLIWELDASLSQTGKSFSATTNNEGFFEMTNSMEFASSYVKLSVNGYYFNEITGKRSSSQITLEAIADIKDKNNINANLVTHLEFKRVLYLINKEKKNFTAAKIQAAKELLACFLITGKDISPETTSITENNTQANMLVAISSILLRAVEGESDDQMDATFTELINNLRDDFEKDGQISDKLKEIIKDASYGLNYEKVKENIENKYQELGKNVTVGKFHYFIDGDGDGILSEEDYIIDEKPINLPEEDGFFKTEQDYKMIMANVLQNVSNAAKQVYLFDALFTHSISYNLTNYNLNDIYNHQISPTNSFVYKLFSTYYKAINQTNLIIEKGGKKEEFLKYKYTSMVYRAYCYLTMIELWGDIPFVTKVPDINEMYIPRTNKNEILNYLVNDLLEAEKYLPEAGDYMICSQHLASALLANAYMQRKDYADALLQTSKIIQSNKYQLCTNYSDIFKPANKETLFSFLANDGDEPIFNELIRKGQETPMIRYAGILLMAAETNLKEGKPYEAKQLVNQVKARNNRTRVSENASADDIKNAILEEWKTDLTKEGVLFFALKRFGLAETTLQIPAYMTLLPIPQKELYLNMNMTQNPGY